METKKCSKCSKKKEVTEFNWRNKAEKKRQTACKICTRKQTKGHYENNKQYYSDKAKPVRIEQAKRNKKFIREHLEGHSCVDCGEGDLRVLHFDHVRGKKEGNVSKMVAQGLSLTRIKKEMTKCEIRCANCHMKRTFDDLGWKK